MGRWRTNMNIVEAVQSADRALGPRLLYRLFEGAMQIEDRNKRIKTGMLILLAGRLTMRLKTIQHVREAWINWARGEIVVPKFDACDCYRCWVEAYNWWLRQGYQEIKSWDEEERPDWFDADIGLSDYKADQKEKIPETAGLDAEDLVDFLCQKKHDPKTPSGGRVIPFGWSPRITAVLLTFFSQYECIEENKSTLDDWITEAAENAEGLNPDEVYPHGLRADGLTFFIRLTGDPMVGGEIGGQRDWQSINRYKSMLDRVTTEQVYYAAGKGNWAPPVVPEKPGQRFPLVLDEELIGGEWKDYDPAVVGHPEARIERHRERQDVQISLYHPRGDLHDSMPWGRAGFPDRDEIDYDRYDDHETPGSANEDYEHIEGEPVTDASTIAEFTNPHDVPRASDAALDEQQSQLGTHWEQMRAVLSPHVLLEFAKLDPIRGFLTGRRRELLVYAEAMGDMLNPVSEGPNPERVKTILSSWMGAVLLIAFSFAQTGIYANQANQAVFLISLLVTLVILPWGTLDVEAAFRNRTRRAPSFLSRYD